MSDLYLDDEEFNLYIQKISKIHESLEKRLEKIIQQFKLASTGVASGDFHINILEYINKLTVMQGQLGYFTIEMKNNASDFCANIESIDTIN